MLSIETEARVAKLFLIISEGEKSVEITRQVLAEQLDFDPYKIFKRLDVREKNFIDEFDVVDFLKLNSVYISLNEARFIIFFYDSDRDGNLNYSEFLNFVLSDINVTLRRLARERIGLTYNRITLPYDVEYSLSKLFERELELVRDIELSLNDINTRYDFNVFDLYSSIQSLSYLTGDNIRKFLLRNDAVVTDGDIQAIVKRLDTDRDSRISFNEFKKLFTFQSTGGKDTYSFNKTGNMSLSSSTFQNTTNSLGRYNSPLRRTASPLRSTVSPLRSFSPNRSVRYASPFRSTFRSPLISRSPLRSTVRSPLRSQNLNRSFDLGQSRITNLTDFKSSKSHFKTTNNFGVLSYEEENFIEFLKDMIVIENDIERIKCDLALRSDFNVEDAFRIFELDERGYLSDLDIKYGLNSLDMFNSLEEINLLIKRYDFKNEGFLSYANFFQMIAPYDREYRRILENRIPSTYVNRFNKTDVFLSTTNLYLKDLLNLILRSEARVEGWRQRFNKMTRFNVRTIFEKMDRIDKNYITQTDISNYLQRNNVNFFTKDVDFLLFRFDRDLDDRISYSEFSNELYPKSRELFVI